MCESERVPRGTFVRESDPIRTHVPRAHSKDRPANILPALPHTKVLTEAPVAESRDVGSPEMHDIFAQ